MKRVLLILSLMVPAWLYSCTGTKPPTLTPTEVIDRAHEAFPTVPEVTRVPAETFERNREQTTKPDVQRRHVHPKKAARKNKPAARPVPRPRPPADQETVEPLPQQGTICIFPFSLIPQCTPGEAG